MVLLRDKLFRQFELCLIIISTVVCGYEAPVARAGDGLPSIRVAGSNEVNLGTFRLKEEKTVEFTVMNSGGGVLDILRVHETCGCVEAGVSTNRLVAGETATIEVRVVGTSEVFGPFIKSVYVESNDPTNHLLQLTIMGRVVGEQTGNLLSSSVSTNEAALPDNYVSGKGVSQVSVFMAVGCSECGRIRNKVLPALRERGQGFMVYDLNIKTNVEMMLDFMKKTRPNRRNASTSAFFGEHAYYGYREIYEGLVLGKAPDLSRSGGARDNAVNGFDAFTVSAIVVAGLVDGINPCAIATLVFFMSILSVSKVQGRGLLAMGVSFCFATFVTYIMIGLGLFNAMYLLSGFGKVRFGLELLMIAALLLMACLSFRDAYRYKLSGNAADVSLQLPSCIKTKIHDVMREQMNKGKNMKGGMSSATAVEMGWTSWRMLVVGGLVTGAMVTALESVCTGQVYVPVIVMVIKSGSSVAKAAGFLALYNLMFIVPVVVVFMLTFFGLRKEALLCWSRRNVVAGKCALGILFILLSILMLKLP